MLFSLTIHLIWIFSSFVASAPVNNSSASPSAADVTEVMLSTKPMRIMPPPAKQILSKLELPSNATSIRPDISDNFSCQDKIYGYYADVENDCQIFHVCLPVTYPDGKAKTFRWSFVCPEETIFSQEHFTCIRPDDWSGNCSQTDHFIELNKQFGASENGADDQDNNDDDDNEESAKDMMMMDAPKIDDTIPAANADGIVAVSANNLATDNSISLMKKQELLPSIDQNNMMESIENSMKRIVEMTKLLNDKVREENDNGEEESEEEDEIIFGNETQSYGLHNVNDDLIKSNEEETSTIMILSTSTKLPIENPTTNNDIELDAGLINSTVIPQQETTTVIDELLLITENTTTNLT